MIKKSSELCELTGNIWFRKGSCSIKEINLWGKLNEDQPFSAMSCINFQEIFGYLEKMGTCGNSLFRFIEITMFGCPDFHVRVRTKIIYGMIFWCSTEKLI